MTEKEDWSHRLQFLREAHKRQHALVEALEAERAPERSIIEAKRKKLQLKDQIAHIEQLQGT
jgi:hypothetical protein